MPAIELDTLLELVGSLNDSTEPGSASERFRKYLRENVNHARDVRAYIERALSQPGDQYNKALQDLINHLGELLEFDVTFGRYRGVRNDIGFDGLWQSTRKKWSIVVETKTTDVYTIKTATVLGYINSLVSDGMISGPTNALGLYVLGRFDSAANQLENAIIVENRQERLRVVSVPALINLLELKQEYHLSHETVLDLLLPSPIRIDPIVDLIRNVVAQEQEREQVEVEIEPIDGSLAANPMLDQVPKAPKSGPKNIVQNYTGKSISAILLDGQRIEVTKWREAMEKVIYLAIRTDKSLFERVAPSLVGRKRPYFSTNPNLLRDPGQVEGTNLFVEKNLSATHVAKVARDLVGKMGYDPADLIFETD